MSVEPFHLFRYLDKQVFRFNKRGTDDAARFRMALAGTSGRHLTYRDHGNLIPTPFQKFQALAKGLLRGPDREVGKKKEGRKKQAASKRKNSR